MPINFFDENAKTSSSNVQFGLCDDPPPAKRPAYIDEIDQNRWIGIVNNSENKIVSFYPIDNCIPLYRVTGELENRCDGMLFFNHILIFVELKTGGSQGWLADGRRQLTETIRNFQANHDMADFIKAEAYICNSFRPMTTKNYANEILKFKNETGLILNVQQKINI